MEEPVDKTNQIILALSIDHKPDLPKELIRIKTRGYIEDLYWNKLGPNRVFISHV